VGMTPEKWGKAILKHADGNYLVQEFQPPYKSLNIDFKLPEPKFALYSNLTGMYVYNGKLTGFYSRQSNNDIVSDLYDENVIASVMADTRC